MTPGRFLELVRAQDPGAVAGETVEDGDYVDATVVLTGGGRLTWLAEVSYGEAQDPVVQAQDPDAYSTDSFQLDDPDDEAEVSEAIEDGIRWAAKWDAQPG